MADIRGILGPCGHRGAVTVLAATLLLALVGCTSQVSRATAQRDPHRAADGEQGQVRHRSPGSVTAPVRLELTLGTAVQPLQGSAKGLPATRSGTTSRIGNWRSPIVHSPSWTTGLANDYSARVANALFLAAGEGPGGQQQGKTTATQFQKFIEQILWGASGPQWQGTGHRRPDCRPWPVTRASPEAIADDMGKGEDGRRRQSNWKTSTSSSSHEIDPESNRALRRSTTSTGTPKGFDIYDNDWLSQVDAADGPAAARSKPTRRAPRRRPATRPPRSNRRG